MSSTSSQIPEYRTTSVCNGREAGAGFADPDYELSVEWRAGGAAGSGDGLARADRQRLVVKRLYGPRKMSKSFRLGKLAQKALERKSCEVDFLD